MEIADWKFPKMIIPFQQPFKKQKKLLAPQCQNVVWNFRFNRFKKSGTYNLDFDWFLWSLSFTNLASRPRLLSFLIFCEFICSKYVFILWQISNIIHKDFIHWNTSRHWRRCKIQIFIIAIIIIIATKFYSTNNVNCTS